MPEVANLFSGPPLVMGILNVTPDSFSDGGTFMTPDSALAHTARMIQDGADIIDVGGESSRPGADAVSAAEQIRRTQSIIAAICTRHPDTLVSIDTRLSEVARAAIDAGATMINDISALRADDNMAALVATSGTPIVLMHMQGTPQTMQERPHYDNVLQEVRTFLAARIQFALARGVAREQIIIDPGFGFGKTVAHNLELLAALDRLTPLAPVLLGTSRKSFISKILNLPHPNRETTGTVVTNTIGLLAGARILRVHDVKPARQAVALCQALGSRKQ